MTQTEYAGNKELQNAASAYADKYGGKFLLEEPDGGLIYVMEDAGYAPPADATVSQVFSDILSGEPLTELWSELETSNPNPDILS